MSSSKSASGRNSRKALSAKKWKQSTASHLDHYANQVEKKEQPHLQVEIIADQSIVPKEKHKKEEIQDQIQQEEEEQEKEEEEVN